MSIKNQTFYSFFANLKQPYKCKMLDKYKGEHLLANGNNVYYLSDEEQQQHKLTIRDGLFYDSTGALCNTIYNSLGGRYNYSALYVISKTGDFYITKKSNSLEKKINHSSLLAGKSTICAGFLSIVNGKLRSISNESGHYQPTLYALYYALFLLEENNISTDLLEIRYQGVASFRTLNYGQIEDFVEAHPYNETKTINNGNNTMKHRF